MKIGFIGLGLMGGAICRSVIRTGNEVYVFDFAKEKVEAMAALAPNAHGAASAAELADADVVFTSLPLPRHVLETMTGPDGLMTKMKKGSVHIDVSTIDPGTAETLEAFGKKYGVGFLGCPEGKGPAQAEKAEQPIFAGGDRAVYEKLLPLLQQIGSPVYYLGGARQAYAFKLISNMVGMTNLAVLAEGIRVAEAAGLDGKQFQQLLADTGADSAQLHMRGEAIRTRDFHNKFGVNLALKDVRIGVDMAKAWGYDARFTEMAREFYQKASEAGYGMEDCAAVFKVL
jgi:3-hydroxyisobutyrate dehydrogenase-like beta-hydroxyacid dehydrogenase